MLHTEDIWLISPPMINGAGAWGGEGAIRLLLLAWGSGIDASEHDHRHHPHTP